MQLMAAFLKYKSKNVSNIFPLMDKTVLLPFRSISVCKYTRLSIISIICIVAHVYLARKFSGYVGSKQWSIKWNLERVNGKQLLPFVSFRSVLQAVE